jgi:hypothetical protein
MAPFMLMDGMLKLTKIMLEDFGVGGLGCCFYYHEIVVFVHVTTVSKHIFLCGLEICDPAILWPHSSVRFRIAF